MKKVLLLHEVFTMLTGKYGLLNPASLALIFIVGAPCAWADLFDVEASYQALNAPTNGFSGTNTIFQSGLLPQAFYVAPLIVQSEQAKYISANVLYVNSAASSINDLNITNGELHGWITASSESSGPVTARAQTYETLFWFDTWTVLSDTLPVGTPVSITVKNHLDGSIDGSGHVATDSINFGLTLHDTRGYGAVDFTNLYTTPQLINLNRVGILTTLVGNTVSLEEQLELQTVGSQTFSASANAASTAFTNIISLTPGVTVKSASGIDYSKVGTSTVPEPSYIWLVGLVLAFIGAREVKSKLACLQR